MNIIDVFLCIAGFGACAIFTLMCFPPQFLWPDNKAADEWVDKLEECSERLEELSQRIIDL